VVHRLPVAGNGRTQNKTRTASVDH